MRAAWAVIVAVGLALAGPLAGAAQPAGKVFRIGVLEIDGPDASAAHLGAFRDGLRALGYVEGQHYVIELRSAEGRFERFRDLAKELVRLEPDVIVTRGNPAALAARHASRTTPIVMATSGDPRISGVVRSLDRPGGNVTGFHVMVPSRLGGERLQLLRQVAPAVSHVGLLWNTADIYPPPFVKDTERAARTLGVRLKNLEVQNPEALEAAFEMALFSGVDGLIAVEDYLVITERARIVSFATMSRIPAVYGLREFVDAGGLMSYGADRRDLYRRSAGYVHRILNGAKPGDLPVEAPTKFELAINLKTARLLGLTIPPALLQRADHLVE